MVDGVVTVVLVFAGVAVTAVVAVAIGGGVVAVVIVLLLAAAVVAGAVDTAQDEGRILSSRRIVLQITMTLKLVLRLPALHGRC